ncbi:5-formyltetrahydrofolate cyclo-ligase [Corynebacterium glyciniphilum]|uniref:5-formyltetrahydrofolate cyclo-ligase n=1 Tax=Corynebacterium glyciniphilum TaxID=1404244 RepID=UPI0011AB3959|nr:5-formyltetrahydrofolate cyclo-ligase [Corynebacterium glyciniphilum]
MRHETDHAARAVRAAKQELRQHIRAGRRAVPPGERSHRDAAIADHLRVLLDGDADRAVAAFAGLPGEPGGAGLPDTLRDAGFEIWLPVVPGPARPLSWLPYRGAQSTRRGTFGIAEPSETPEFPSPISTMDLSGRVSTLVIPALAVDRDGTRLGQGGGYYDRTFSVLTGCGEPGTLVAVVDHSEFGVDVPRTGHDASVQIVVTDSGIFPTSTGDRPPR